MKSKPLAEIFEDERKERIAGFKFPSWLKCECRGCKFPLGPDDITSFEIHFEPMFIGDVSFHFFCKKCYSAFSRHLKCNLKNLNDLEKILSKEENVFNFIDQNELFDFSEHNIVKRLSKEI